MNVQGTHASSETARMVSMAIAAHAMQATEGQIVKLTLTNVQVLRASLELAVMRRTATVVNVMQVMRKVHLWQESAMQKQQISH